MKRKKAIDFLTVTLFFGILLSFTIYLGLGAMINADGGVVSGNGDRNISFNAEFFEDGILGDFVKFCDYRIFKHIDDSDMIIGKDDWLFEAVDSESGYERLLDYIGGCPFSDEELARIGGVISERRMSYEEAGVEYIMIVIPDSMTVCSDKVPRYLGGQSENTRLSALTAYLAGEGEPAFVNPAGEMIAGSEDMPMYNNTENSINAYGAYCIYDAAVSRFFADKGEEADRIYFEDVEFYTRVTDGRSVAVKAGLEKTIRNRTVSLSDNMPQNYSVMSGEKGIMLTEHGDALSAGNGKVVVECSDEWVRTQLMPYFSNTFDKVYYRAGISAEHTDNLQYEPTLVVQIIHESELAGLLEK
ncbi:MAG: hypothetical protein IJY08_05155 [Clostridia bacterium]|nr:hypothetical protein [Clostridia bacterium]